MEIDDLVPKELPDDALHYNILTRLPAASLVHFKRVSKDWYTLINSSTFINIHQNYVLNTDNYSSDFMIFLNELSLRTTLFYVYRDNNDSYSLCGRVVENVNPPKLFADDVIGYSNGLFLIRSFTHLRFELFNPLTRESRMLTYPSHSTRGTRYERCFCKYGFGYDSTNRVYKIAIISIFGNISFIPQVYNTGTKLWKTLEEVSLPLEGFESFNGDVINNALHWLFSRKGEIDKYSILTFNLHTETLGRMTYPPKHGNDSRMMDLFVLDGRLHMMVESTVSGVSLWVIKEYGVVESWMNLYNFDKHEISIKKILAYRPKRDGGEVLLVQRVNNQNVLLWYNLKNKSTRKIDTLNNIGSDSSFEYMCNGSLAPICGSI